ncbi:alternative ribosome rescue aminoacyl-tRNA hydrolase ArfB [Olivibacter sp. XZL3]|uniref:alternative ribosome rescue aminoacyl-tRNA hydrolase ArfB n=1 Tax=Olivibacter sp. XZL3 TaxID=1735116 RepID=UPI001064F4F5|nr:alternative ribosome rescue aminoacyl-tRNA hydrolase ArfB [Olivibacter sp. XZL3]
MYDIDELEPYIHYKASRSGGSGGQHVNKVASKVELLFDFESCNIWNKADKDRIRQKLGGRLSSEGKLQIISQEHRSQFKNKELTQQKLLKMLTQASTVPKQRKPTKRSKESVEKRLEDKRYRALQKISRSKYFD